MPTVIDPEQYRVQPGTKVHLPDWVTKTNTASTATSSDAKAC